MKQITLFDLTAFSNSPIPISDPYWDYDDSEEPPDPDDYPNLEEYHEAWSEWEGKYPELVSEVRAMSDPAPEQIKIGDQVRLSTEWLDKCAASLGEPYSKDYLYEAEQDLIRQVFWIGLKGDIYVDGYGGAALYVPAGCFVLEQKLTTAQNSAPEQTPLVLEQLTTAHNIFPNHDSRVLEQELTTAQNSAPEHSHWIETYSVTRSGNKYWYYRYVWMRGRKLHHVHVPGGNLRSRHARELKQMVEKAIALGSSPKEIEKLIRQPR